VMHVYIVDTMAHVIAGWVWKISSMNLA
jgi:hypothetical protein